MTRKTRETVGPFVDQRDQGDQKDQGGRFWWETFGGKHLVGTFERFSEQLLLENKILDRDLCGKI